MQTAIGMRPSIRKILLMVLCQSLAATGYGQGGTSAEIRSASELGDSLFACDSPYWKLVAKGKDAIPSLIDAITDTTRTASYHVCKTDPLRTGDIAYIALGEIIAIPFFSITGHQLCVMDENGCMMGLFEYIEKHRSAFQDQLRNWYAKEGSSYKWYRYSSNDRKVLNTCYRMNGIQGMYR